MSSSKRYIFAAVLAGFLSGCQTLPLKEEAKPVRLVFDESVVSKCQKLGNFVGSHGHWYTYLFINNDVLTESAFNDLLNKASAVHADTVYVPRLVNQFQTSVTIFGEAFQCRGRESRSEEAL
jgi:hypothetical protein